ncbi:unnamed protein product [Cuscuta europaea]|uniref:Uncharacterized protein n=1 Tax=Cuscuta europaea TaxID=41803 RepID=A0A9P0Z8N4_CUSEU|nr:unnamed protein product [Cuscuta europaea]
MAEMTRHDQNGGASIFASMDLEFSDTRSSIQQFTPLDEHASKVRKPYTITKQRERWTEEEHSKFLDALKLYGRAWRRIEEHVSTKTAVQIRSHAQKFFSKVAREKVGSDVIPANPIEIPPPRPKRKPLHPYPRKLISPGGGPAQENLATQSPASVSSPLDSESEGPTNSTVNGSMVVSPGPGDNSSRFFVPSEQCDLMVEEIRSSSSLVQQDTAIPSPNEQPFLRLELLPKETEFMEDCSAEASSSHRLKLFGKTVLAADSHRPSSSRALESLSTDEVEDMPASQALPWGLVPVKLFLGNSDSLYYPLVVAKSQLWGSPCATTSLSCSTQQVHDPMPIKVQSVFENKKREEQENHLEASSMSSNSKSIEISSMKLRARSTKRKKGFLPYKRCLAEKENHASTMMGEDREEQRTRLCL